MDTLTAIERRHSCRSYSSEPLSRTAIERIVDAGRRAPTARNEQPWEFIVLTERDMLKKIAGITDFGSFIAEAGACVALLCKDTKYYVEDGSAATTTMLIAAAAMDIDSCWVAGDKKEYAGEICKLLGAPEYMKLVALVALGHAAAGREATPKRPLNDVLHWENFA